MKPQEFGPEKISKKLEEWVQLASTGNTGEIIEDMSSLFISSLKATSPERESTNLRHPLTILVKLFESKEPPSEEQVQSAFVSTVHIGYAFDERWARLKQFNKRIKVYKNLYAEEQEIRINNDSVISSRNAELEALREKHREEINELKLQIEDREEQLNELRDNGVREMSGKCH